MHNILTVPPPDGLNDEQDWAVQVLQQALQNATLAGLVVTVEQVALWPWAMGRADTLLSVRPVIDHVGEAALLGGYAP